MHSWFVAILALAVAALPTDAIAEEGCGSVVEAVSMVLPAPGATGVPRNAVVHVHAYNSSDPASVASGLLLQREMILRETIPISVTLLKHDSPAIASIRLQPSSPLQSGQDYFLVDDRGLLPVDLASFTTSSALDFAAPPAPEPSIAVGLATTARGPNCRADRVRKVAFGLQPSTDPIVFSVLSGGEPLATDEPLQVADGGQRFAEALVYCDVEPTDAGIAFFQGDRRFVLPADLLSLRIEARDGAGNTALSATDFVLDTRCPPADAGEPDAGIDVDAGEQAPDDAGVDAGPGDPSDGGDGGSEEPPGKFVFSGGAGVGCQAGPGELAALCLVFGVALAWRKKRPLKRRGQTR